MRMEITARQLGGSWGLPVHIPYRGLPGRLGGDGLFAKSIIAKYMTSEEQTLPSADFAYPESGRAAAEEMLSELASQLIVMNRIRIQMNIHNRHILRQYSISVSNRCEQLLNELGRQPFLVSGVAPAAVRELRQIWREMAQPAGRSASGEVPEEESMLILRVLTAASRGNGNREQYMRLLVRKLQETGADMQTGQISGEGARSLLARAGTELFRTERAGRSVVMTGWASELSRQFFWRIQRAPEQTRQIFLRAGGFTSLVALEKVLRTMDDTAFRNFFTPLIERVGAMAEHPEEAGNAGGVFAMTDSRRSAHPAEEDPWSEWLYFSRDAEGYGPSADLNDVSPETVLRMESFLENSSGREWEQFRRELVRTDRSEVVRGLLPEYFSERPVTGSREKELLFRALDSRADTAGQLRIQVLETLRKMAVVRYLPSDTQQLISGTDIWIRGLEYIRGGAGSPEPAAGQQGTDQEAVFRMEDFLESRSTEEWEQFRTELVHADRDGEIRRLLPEFFSEQPETEDREREILFRMLDRRTDTAEQLQSRVLETIRRIAEVRNTSSGTDVQQLVFGTDTWTRGLEYIRGAEGMQGPAGQQGPDQEMVFRMESFLENRSIEEWDQFRTELIHADREGEIRNLLPGFFAERQEAPGQAMAGTPGMTGTPGTSGAAGADGGSVMIMKQEKELLFRILREDRDAVRQLRTVILEIIRRISVIRENQKEYMTLAESIISLTGEQWRQLKEEVRILRTEDREFRSLVSDELFAPADMEQRILPPALTEAEADALEAGIRMSSEKMAFLKTLQEQSLRSDSVLTDTGRKLYIRTVLRSTEAGRLIQPSYRELSAEGKENWRRFLSELLQQDTASGWTGNTAGLYFGRITERYGIREQVRESAERDEAAGTAVRTEAALSYLERTRGERVLTGQGPEGPGQESGEVSAEVAQAPELTASADLTVPAAQAAAGNRSAGTGQTVRPGDRKVIRTESYHDIEFETVTHTDREETHTAEDHQIKELSDVLERHEREISKLIRTQENIAEQDLPKEVMRQLNGKLRMERLRGGL